MRTVHRTVRALHRDLSVFDLSSIAAEAFEEAADNTSNEAAAEVLENQAVGLREGGE